MQSIALFLLQNIRSESQYYTFFKSKLNIYLTANNHKQRNC